MKDYWGTPIEKGRVCTYDSGSTFYTITEVTEDTATLVSFDEQQALVVPRKHDNYIVVTDYYPGVRVMNLESLEYGIIKDVTNGLWISYDHNPKYREYADHEDIVVVGTEDKPNQRFECEVAKLAKELVKEGKSSKALAKTNAKAMILEDVLIRLWNKYYEG